MDTFHLCLDWATGCLWCCKHGSPSCKWEEAGSCCDVLGDRSLTRSDRDSLDELDRFLREDWESSGWEQRLRDLAEVYGQQLFRSPQLKEYYKKCAKLGNGLRVIVEDRVPNEDEGNENCNTCLPSELWRWANRFAVLEHPVFNRMKLEIPHTSYSEPLLFPEIPDLILLIAGEPKGYGNPSADDMVDGIADIWKGYSKKFAEKHGKYPRIIKLHFEQATRSRIQDAIENPLAQPDRMHVYQPRPLTGLIHWIGRADVERDNLRSLWVRGDKHELQELHPERLVLFLKGARERRIHWQFFFLCSYRKEQDMTPIPTTGCSQVIEPLVLKAGVPSVPVLKRPVWRDSALALATEFYNKLLEPYYETRLPERGIPKTLLEVRKSLHQDFRDGTEACYYAWTSPVLVMQQTEETMPPERQEAEKEQPPGEDEFEATFEQSIAESWSVIPRQLPGSAVPDEFQQKQGVLRRWANLLGFS